MRSWRSRVALSAGIVVLAVALVGCGGPSLPEGEPSIRGVVTAVSPAASGTGGSMRVVWVDDATVGARAEFDAADVAVTEETALYRRPETADVELETVEFSEISTGDIVEAWFTGAVAESYPVQATASSVIVTEVRYDGELPTPPGLEPEPAP